MRDDSSKAKQGHRAWPCFGYSMLLVQQWLKKVLFFGSLEQFQSSEVLFLHNQHLPLAWCPNWCSGLCLNGAFAWWAGLALLWLQRSSMANWKPQSVSRNQKDTCHSVARSLDLVCFLQCNTRQSMLMKHWQQSVGKRVSRCESFLFCVCVIFCDCVFDAFYNDHVAWCCMVVNGRLTRSQLSGKVPFWAPCSVASLVWWVSSRSSGRRWWWRLHAAQNW